MSLARCSGVPVVQKRLAELEARSIQEKYVKVIELLARQERLAPIIHELTVCLPLCEPTYVSNSTYLGLVCPHSNETETNYHSSKTTTTIIIEQDNGRRAS